MSCRAEIPLRRTITLGLLLALWFILAIRDVEAQPINESHWQAHANARLKSIYERGEYRAKKFQPTWRSDSSGLVLDGVDPTTMKPVQWFHDARSGERRILGMDEKNADSNAKSRSSEGRFRIESRAEKLVAVDPENQTEILLVSNLSLIHI